MEKEFFEAQAKVEYIHFEIKRILEYVENTKNIPPPRIQELKEDCIAWIEEYIKNKKILGVSTENDEKLLIDLNELL